jgi:hypothetical protein
MLMFQVGDVVVDGFFFAGSGGSSAWSGNRSFVFSLAAPTSLLFAVSAFIPLPCTFNAELTPSVSDECGVPSRSTITISECASVKTCSKTERPSMASQKYWERRRESAAQQRIHRQPRVISLKSRRCGSKQAAADGGTASDSSAQFPLLKSL